MTWKQWKKFCRRRLCSGIENSRRNRCHHICPRQCGRQVFRANTGSTSEEYYRRSIYVPYVDSLIQSLKTCFSETNTPAFLLYWLHQAQLEKAERPDYKEVVQTIHQSTTLTILSRTPYLGMTWPKRKFSLVWILKTRKNWNLWTWWKIWNFLQPYLKQW